MNFNSISTSYINLYKLNNQELFLARSLNKLKDNPLIILNELIWYANAHGRIFPSHETLADKTKLCTKTISRHLKLLVKLGFIVIRDLHRNSNSYYLNPVFLRMKFRNALRFLLSNLKWFTFKLILSATLSTLAFGNTCQIETVQSLIKKNFIKMNVCMYMPNNNEMLKKQQHTHVKHSKVASHVTNRKEGELVMSQSEIKISWAIQEVAQKMKLTEDQEIKLAQFPDHIVQNAYNKIKHKALDNPFTYLFRVCSRDIQQEIDNKTIRPKVTREDAPKQRHIPLSALSSSSKHYKDGGKFHKNYTAVEIAQQMAKIAAIDAKDMYGGVKYQIRILQEWADKEYIADGSPEEYAALRFIDKFRLRFDMTPRCPINQPESPTLNEKAVSGTTSQEVKKDSTSLIYERDDEYEEVTDETLCDTW